MKVTKEVLYEALFFAVQDTSRARLDIENECPSCKLSNKCYDCEGGLCESILIDFYTGIANDTVKKRKEMLK